MADEPVNLDAHRDKAAREASELRRQRIHQVQIDQASLRQRREEVERLLLAAPAETWPEVAANAQYLIQLFAATPEAQEPRRKQLIAHVLNDLARLSDQSKDRP